MEVEMEMDAQDRVQVRAWKKEASSRAYPGHPGPEGPRCLVGSTSQRVQS